MHLRWTAAIAILVLLAAGGASARRPWQPSMTVEAAECIGRRVPEPGPREIKRFKAFYSRAEAYYAAGRYRQAGRLLKQALELHPDHVGARILHARILLTLGYLTWNLPMIREARGDIRHAQAIEPKNENLQRMVELLDGLLKRMTAAGAGTTRRKPLGKPK